MGSTRDFREKLEDRIPYREAIFKNQDIYEDFIDDLIDISKDIVLSIRFPFVDDYSEMEVPSKYKSWQFRCCLELYNGIGKEGLTSYSENGLSWSKSTDLLSQGLMEEITPRVGVLKKTSAEMEWCKCTMLEIQTYLKIGIKNAI